MRILKQRKLNESRIIKITKKYTHHPEGSVLIELGNTKVLCTATISNSVPRFLRGKKRGWITAEYNMLPRSTNLRSLRESVIGKRYGRNIEIQRFISRSLRSSVDLEILKSFTIILDCDVLQADGGTRTAAINGSFIALIEAVNFLLKQGKIKENPIKYMIAAISVGIVENKELCDLDYSEDSHAEVDMNVVMTEKYDIIEIQSTVEGNNPISQTRLISLIELAKKEIAKIFKIQKIY